MKKLLLAIISSILLIGCAKSNMELQDTPQWLQQKINETEAAIQSDVNSVYKSSSWYRYQFNGKSYYEFHNPAKAAFLNLFDESGRQPEITTQFTIDYQSSKCCGVMVWGGPYVVDYAAPSDASKLLQRTWINSVEEGTTNGELVYRPAGYKTFPALRYRHQIEFNANNKGRTLVLAANDAHYFDDITWNYDAGNRTLNFTGKNGESASFIVTELNAELLKLKRK